MTTKQKWILRFSITINIIFGIVFFINHNAYTYKEGILNEDVKVGIFNNNKSTFFTLPKGLTVRDVSEQGISAVDRFENNRFEIVITTDRDNLVDYKVSKEKLSTFGNLYSADSQLK
jgi:hypothetical protein